MDARSANGAGTLPRKYFTSPKIFAAELRDILRKRWIYAGHVSHFEKPGSYLLYQVGQDNILILRDEENGIRAFHNVCRHRGTQLCEQSEGQLDGRIQCPYHGWTFGLNGSLLGAPNMRDCAGFDPNRYPLISVAVHVWNGLIFLNFSERAGSFEQAFAPISDRVARWQIFDLKSVRQITYEVQANWKLVFQNYSECYHCPKVHPALSKLTPYRASLNYLREGPFLGGPMQILGESMTMDGRSCAATLPYIEKEDQRLVYYYTIFPSIFLTLHPDYVMVHRCRPVSPDHTRITCEWLFHPEAITKPDFDPSSAIEFWDLTNRQDWHVCELSQRGISSSAYTPGPYSDLESLLAAFDREYLRAMHQTQREFALAD